MQIGTYIVNRIMYLTFNCPTCLNCPTCSPMGKGPHRAFREVAMKDRLTLYLRGVSAGAIATIFLSTPVMAQDVTGGAPAATSDESEAIVVTGTRIRRPNLDSNSPMTVVSDEEFRDRKSTR